MSESVLRRDDTKKITGNMAAINTPQNNRIFLYGRLFLGGTTTGLVGIASIVPPRIPYIFSQCKAFGCRKRGNFCRGYFSSEPILFLFPQKHPVYAKKYPKYREVLMQNDKYEGNRYRVNESQECSKLPEIIRYSPISSSY